MKIIKKGANTTKWWGQVSKYTIKIMRLPIKKPFVSLLGWLVEKIKRKYKGSKNRKVIKIKTIKLLKFRPSNSKKIIRFLVKLKDGLISKSLPFL